MQFAQTGFPADFPFSDRTGITVWFLLSGVVTLFCGVLGLALPAVRNCDKLKS